MMCGAFVVVLQRHSPILNHIIDGTDCCRCSGCRLRDRCLRVFSGVDYTQDVDKDCVSETEQPRFHDFSLTRVPPKSLVSLVWSGMLVAYVLPKRMHH